MNDLRKFIIRYYLEEYFGIDVQTKVLDFEFEIPFLRFDSLILSPIINYKIWKLKLRIPSKFDYKQNFNIFWVKFVEMNLKWDFFKHGDSLKFLCFLNLWPHFCKATFELQSILFWFGQQLDILIHL